MPILERPVMNNAEARAAVARMGKWIKRGLSCGAAAQQIYLEFDERRGWESYTDEEGIPIYDDGPACIRRELRELGITKQRAHQLVDFATIQRDIGSTVVDSKGKTKDQVPQDDQGKPALCERLLRPLGRIKDPEKRREIFQRAIDAAGGDKVSATFLAQAAKAIAPPPEPKAEDRVLKMMEEIQKLGQKCLNLGCEDAYHCLNDAYHTLGRFDPNEDQGNQSGQVG
jgi:hypothetical protein